MILDSTSKSISITLGEAITTNDLDVVVAYADVVVATPSYVDGSSDGTSNGVTETTIVAAPAASTQRRVKLISIYNNDTVLHNVTIKFVDSTNKRVVWAGLLPIGAILTWSNGAWSVGTQNAFNSAIEFIMDGLGAVLTSGNKGYLTVPFDCTINSATLLADQTGTIAIEIQKCSYSDFDAGSTHPVSGDKINASAPPTITTGVKSQDSTLSGWTTSLSRGDILHFNLLGTPTIVAVTRLTLSLDVTKV